LKPNKGKHSLKKGNLLFKINDKFLLKPAVHFLQHFINLHINHAILLLLYQQSVN